MVLAMSVDPPLIRAARASDARAIAQTIRDSKYAAMPWLAQPHTLTEDETWVAQILLHEADVTVAVDPGDDRILAVMATTPGWLEQLYVATSQQHRGLGSLLLRRAQESADGPLELWAFQRNVAAREFYERHGFVEVRRTDGDNEEREPDVLYRWER